MSHNVRSLSSILDDLIEERATDEPARYRQRLDKLLSHYKQLLVLIDETSQRCSVTIPAKINHEKYVQLNTLLTNLSNISMNFRDLSDVRSALQNQTKVCDTLQIHSQQVSEIVTSGNELLRQPMVPKYVQQDIQNIQKVYNEKMQSAQDLLEKLKVRRKINFFCSSFNSFLIAFT
jgi:ABC-type transporter Mla subunit MlaD